VSLSSLKEFQEGDLAGGTAEREDVKAEGGGGGPRGASGEGEGNASRGAR